MISSNNQTRSVKQQINVQKMTKDIKNGPRKQNLGIQRLVLTIINAKFVLWAFKFRLNN